MLDVFNQDAFSVVSLTDAINKPKFVPGRLGQLGIFQETPVATTSVSIEERDGLLVLVSPTPRGGPGVTLDKAKRTARVLKVPHFEINDGVMAEEVQNVRPFGQESGLETVQTVVAGRLLSHRSSHEATLEYARVGAVIGVVTYADSSTLNLFTEFGVSQDAEIAFDLANATPAAGALRKAVQNKVIRGMAKNLDGIPFTGVRAICGDDFFDDLLANVEVRAAFLNNPAAKALLDAYIQGNGQSYGAFEFAGVVWENYRGAVGSTTFVNADKAHFFPTGVPGLFRTYFAPADYMETVNTLGQRVYAKQYAMDNDKGVNLDSQMNTLNICTRPKSLIKGKRGS
jgi:hypothetical protein